MTTQYCPKRGGFLAEIIDYVLDNPVKYAQYLKESSAYSTGTYSNVTLN